MTKFLFLTLLAVVMVGSVSGAQMDAAEEAQSAASKSKRRQYPGGSDEQELAVQAVLAQTTRNPEAPKAPVATPTEAEDSESHD